LIEKGFNPKTDLPESVNAIQHTEQIDYLRSNSLRVLKWVKERQTIDSGTYSWSYIERHLSDKHEERMELKRTISQRMYQMELKRKDVVTKTLFKRFFTFIFDNIIFMVEQYELDGEEVSVLRVNTDTYDLKQMVLIPPFIKCSKDISEDINHFQSNLALLNEKEVNRQEVVGEVEE